MPGAEEYAKKARQKAIESEIISWLTEARIGELLGPGKPGQHAPCNDLQGSNEHDRYFARQFFAALESGILGKYIERVESQGPVAYRAPIKITKETVEIPDLPCDKYRVLYADPPWEYGNAQHGKEEQDTVLETHYPTMPDDILLTLPVYSISAEESVLFCWATSPRIRFALALTEVWGFEYKAMFVWDKVKHNVGYYNSVRHELLLICTRGSCLPGRQGVARQRGEHRTDRALGETPLLPGVDRRDVPEGEADRTVRPRRPSRALGQVGE